MTPLSAQHHPACYPSRSAEALAFFREAVSSVSIDNQPSAKAKGTLTGIITPHIDFRVSLRAYVHAFRPLLEEPLADSYIILGVGHRSRLEWNLDRRDYETPLGHAICDPALVDALAADGDPARQFSAPAHEGEHSVEFALVWLQALHQLQAGEGNKAKPVRFAPLLCGGMHNYVENMTTWEGLTDFHRISRNLAGVLDNDAEKNVRIIVSIDGCHLGPRFHHPFRVTQPLLKATAGWEELLWQSAAGGDARIFLDWFQNEGNDRYFDGVGALALLLAAGNQARAKKLTVRRTYYEQWFTEHDASVVTFSSGQINSFPD